MPLLYRSNYVDKEVVILKAEILKMTTIAWLVSGKASGGSEVGGAGTARGQGHTAAQLPYEARHANFDPGSDRLCQSTTGRCHRLRCTYARIQSA